MSGQHTAGPWEALKGLVESDEMRCGVVAVRGDMRYLVAQIENGAPGDFCETEWANAQLIAASPDLLKACTDWIGWLDSDGWRDDAADHEARMLNAMRSAIASATGAA